jgi:hypothetical protein
VTDLTSDRIPLRDIPINHQLQARLAEAHVRIAELHTAVTTAIAERDRACASREGMRSSLSRLGAEVVKLNEEAERLTVQREQLAATLADVLRHIDQQFGAGGAWYAEDLIPNADVQRWRNVLNQHGGDINEDALRPTSPTGDPN